MSTLYLGLAGFLLLTILAGFVRILCGSTATDRMQATMLLGTTGVAIPCCSSRRHSQRARYADMVLSFSLLAAVTVVTFVLLTWSDLE